jgi:hypothetical protein
MPAPDNSKRPTNRWTTLKESSVTILFLLIAGLAEFLVVLYALSFGTEDSSLLQWSFQFPGTSWNVTLAVSPLFHLVPIAVIIALTTTWIYLTKHAVARPQQTWKGKAGQAPKAGKKAQSKISRVLQRFFGRIRSGLLKIKGFAYLEKKINSRRTTIRSALIVLLLFAFFVIFTSLLVYPQMIYRMVSDAYQNNPSMLGFVRGAGEALSPIGNVFSSLNNALLYVAPGFRDFVISLESVTAPLSSLDGAGKYLVFQNAAAWISALIALLLVEFSQKGYRYRKR